jgi:hypothetical protein
LVDAFEHDMSRILHLLTQIAEIFLHQMCGWWLVHATVSIILTYSVNIGLVEKPISTYMPLTLARLCGEWQLVSGANYSRYE